MKQTKTLGWAYEQVMGAEEQAPQSATASNQDQQAELGQCAGGEEGGWMSGLLDAFTGASSDPQEEAMQAVQAARTQALGQVAVAQASQTCIVQPGDTAGLILKRCGKTSRDLSTLADANPLRDLNVLEPGDALILPSGWKAQTTVDSADTDERGDIDREFVDAAGNVYFAQESLGLFLLVSSAAAGGEVTNATWGPSDPGFDVLLELYGQSTPAENRAIMEPKDRAVRGLTAAPAGEPAELEGAHESGRIESWVHFAEEQGRGLADQAAGAAWDLYALIAGGEDIKKEGESYERQELPEGFGDARDSGTLDAAVEYIDKIDTYGFHQQDKLVSNDGENRGEMTEIWCSGLSTATLIDNEIPMDEPIPGEYYFEGGRRKEVTMRMIVEGMPEPLAATEKLGKELDAIEPTEEDLRVKGGKYAYAKMRAVAREMYAKMKFGEDPYGADDDLRVQGAAGAFVLAGIGTAIREPGQVRPGDFVQSRAIGEQTGHAYQAYEVRMRGNCIEGLPGSPEIVTPGVEQSPHQSGGIQHLDAVFTCGSKTAPELVRGATAQEWSVIESNIGDATGQESSVRNVTGAEGGAAKADGGVVVRSWTSIPSAQELTDARRHLYIGRLSSSAWAAGETN